MTNTISFSLICSTESILYSLYNIEERERKRERRVTFDPTVNSEERATQVTAVTSKATADYNDQFGREIEPA